MTLALPVAFGKHSEQFSATKFTAIVVAASGQNVTVVKQRCSMVSAGIVHGARRRPCTGCGIIGRTGGQRSGGVCGDIVSTYYQDRAAG